MGFRLVLVLSAIGFAGASTVQVRDIDGALLGPFSPAGKANVLFFFGFNAQPVKTRAIRFPLS